MCSTRLMFSSFNFPTTWSIRDMVGECLRWNSKLCCTPACNCSKMFFFFINLDIHSKGQVLPAFCAPSTDSSPFFCGQHQFYHSWVENLTAHNTCLFPSLIHDHLLHLSVLSHDQDNHLNVSPHALSLYLCPNPLA